MIEKIKKKSDTILGLVVLCALGAGIYFFLTGRSGPDEKALTSEIQDGVDVSKVKIADDKVSIDYNQPMGFEDSAELFGTWAYILGVAAQEAPNAKTIEVNCVFEDGQKVSITANRQTVQDFLDEKITPLEFLQLITAEASTKGPEI